ncbi:MAG: hypothetical protein B0W54_04230 [Cellvibrio sp. 79]|nr:MAG: hypothetical protein B0W54_04230 [Cellvibrio sp. 79]
MANTNKTKAEILQELESIKGLLLEEDDIPILQDAEVIVDESDHANQAIQKPASPYTTHESVLPGQASLFEESGHSSSTTETDNKRQDLVSSGHQLHINPLHAGQTPTSRPLAKASGENPFLPQHIRERLHGNNPPPLFEYETAKKIISATKNVAQKLNRPRQHLVDDVIKSMMPQIESELRHRLFAMSVDDLEKLLNDDEDQR